MKKKQDDKFFDEYIQNRKNSSFYNELNSESLLITKIWDFNKTILEKWAGAQLLIAINEVKTNRKMIYSLFVVLIVIAALLMIAIVLIQESKGGGLSTLE